MGQYEYALDNFSYECSSNKNAEHILNRLSTESSGLFDLMLIVPVNS